MEWSREKIYALVSLYEEQQCLWNVRSTSYKNSKEKYDSLQKIAIELETTPSDVEKKIKSLVAQYRREKRKIEESKKSGSGAEFLYEPKWFGFRILQFLDYVHEPKETRETTEEVSQYILSSREEQGEEETAAAATPPQKRAKKRGGKIGKIDKAAVMMEKQQQRRQENDSVADFGKFIVSKLKELPPYQRTVATKRICDVIFEEELKSLQGSQTLPGHVDVTGESSSSAFQSPSSTPDSPVTFIGPIAQLDNEEIVYVSDKNDI